MDTLLIQQTHESLVDQFRCLHLPSLLTQVISRLNSQLVLDEREQLLQGGLITLLPGQQ
jgi:hypothetical protein